MFSIAKIPFPGEKLALVHFTGFLGFLSTSHQRPNASTSVAPQPVAHPPLQHGAHPDMPQQPGPSTTVIY